MTKDKRAHAEHEEELRQCLIERWAYQGLGATAISALLALHGFKPPSGAAPPVAQDRSGAAVASDPVVAQDCSGKGVAK